MTDETECPRGPFELKSPEADYISGRTLRPSCPAKPRQVVGNAKRKPQSFSDMRTEPNLTGTWLEDKERMWLFINHVGGHIQGLLTLVTTFWRYNVPADSLRGDIRIPLDWGVNPERERRMRNGSPLPELAFRFQGDETARTFVLKVPRWIGKPFGEIREESVGTLEITSKGITVEFDEVFLARWPHAVEKPQEIKAWRVDTEPALFERYVARESVSWALRSKLWFPTTPKQLERIADGAAEFFARTMGVTDKFKPSPSGEQMLIYDLLDESRGLGESQSERARLVNIVERIDDITDDVFTEITSLPARKGGVGGPALREQMAPEIRRWLAEIEFPKRDGLPAITMLTQLTRCMDQAPERAMEKIHKWLELDKRGWREHIFAVTLVIDKLVSFDDPRTQETYDKAVEHLKDLLSKYASGGRGGRGTKFLPMTHARGTIEVGYHGWIGQKPGDPVEKWTARYGFVAGGLKVSRKAGQSLSTFHTSTVATKLAASPPLPHELEGACSLSEFFRYGGITGSSKSPDRKRGQVEGVLLLQMFGQGTKGVAAIFEGVEKSNRAGIGVGGKGLVGMMWLKGSGKANVKPLPPKRGEEEEKFDNYWNERIASVQVHFATNGARFDKVRERDKDVMRSTGRLTIQESLKAFTACELALISEFSTKIAIEGFTDRQGKRGKNVELGMNRAKTAKSFLQALLGELLDLRLPKPTPKRRLHLLSDGEVAAEAAGDEDGHPNLAYRRVDLRVGPGEAVEPTVFKVKRDPASD